VAKIEQESNVAINWPLTPFQRDCVSKPIVVIRCFLIKKHFPKSREKPHNGATCRNSPQHFGALLAPSALSLNANGAVPDSKL
jgi:hypothetical protein